MRTTYINQNTKTVESMRQQIYVYRLHFYDIPNKIYCAP